MITAETLTARGAALQQKLREVHGIRGRDLPQSLRRSRHVLPRHLRKASDEIAAALTLVGHPKLEPMIDHARVTALYDALQRELESVDLVERRRTQLITVAARVAFYVLVVSAAFILWMQWAGHL